MYAALYSSYTPVLIQYIYTLCKATAYHYIFVTMTETVCGIREGLNALHLISQKSPKGSSRNSANAGLFKHSLFLTLEGGTSTTSFPHCSPLEAFNAVIFRFVLAEDS